VMRDHPISSAARYGLYGFCAWGSGGAAVAECREGQTPQSTGRKNSPAPLETECWILMARSRFAPLPTSS
jgi:hypothetical protein